MQSVGSFFRCGGRVQLFAPGFPLTQSNAWEKFAASRKCRFKGQLQLWVSSVMTDVDLLGLQSVF